MTIINEFRETTFTKEEFIQTLQPPIDIWIMEDNGKIIATGTILYERKFIHNNGLVGHIEDVCVKESYRNLGIGKQLIQYLIQEGKNKKCYTLLHL